MTALVRYDAACQALAEAKSVDEVKDLADKAEAMRAYAKQAKNRALEIDAAEIRMRAERRLGEILAQQPKNRGAKGSVVTGSAREPVKDDRPTLADIGVDKKLSSRAQKLAAVPAAEFEGMVGEWRDTVQRENERVTARLLNAGEIARKRQSYTDYVVNGGTVDDLSALSASGQRFGVIYADPPWEFKVYSGKGKQRSAERHYDTQSLDDICSLPVADLAADDCALFLWCVMPELPGALKVIESWGFNYKTAGFVWIKQNRSGEGIFTGMGYWTRANAEMCLLATKGTPQRQAMDVHQVVMSPVGAHSAKPDEVRRRIERLVPGPYLELYSREKTRGWSVWGNQIIPDDESVDA